MFVLIIGIVIFFGVHLIPLTSAKVNLIERMGEKKYQGVFLCTSITERSAANKLLFSQTWNSPHL